MLLKRLQKRTQLATDSQLVSILDGLTAGTTPTARKIATPLRPIKLKPQEAKVAKEESIKQQTPKVVLQSPKEDQVQQDTTLKDKQLPDLNLDISLLTSFDTEFTKIIIQPLKKRKLHNLSHTNENIASKTAKNFSKPSPDDIVLKLQENLFEDISKNLNQVSIKDLKHKKVDSVSNVKPQLSFIIFGHVDSGKSTIIGRLLYDLKIVDSKTLHKLQQESEKIGKSSFALAWIMDQTEEERSRGVTVDIITTTIETPKAKLNIIDSPGHLDYVPQLINGISQADVGVLIVDCNDYTTGFNKIKEQVLISYNLGMTTLIVALNKFDLINYDQTHLSKIIQDVSENLLKLGFQQPNIFFTPVSGLLGENIVKKSTKFESQHTLLDLMHQQVPETSESILKESFIMTINEIVESNVKELIVNGRVNAGIASIGDEFKTYPNESIIKLDNPNKAKQVMRGDFLNNLKFKFLQKNDLLTKGDIISNDRTNFKISDKLEVDLRLFDLSKPLLIGTSFVLFHNCKQYPAKISKIESIANAKNNKKRHLVSNQQAKVVIELQSLLLYNAQIDKLTRIVIRKDSSIIGCGIII